MMAANAPHQSRPDAATLPTPDQRAEAGRLEAERAFERGDIARANLSARVRQAVSEFVDTGRYPRVLPAQAAQALSESARDGAVRRRVLLAEDDAAYGLRVAEMLTRRLGVDVIHVPSVAAADVAIQRERYDLAVVDIDLLDGLGMEVIERARGRNAELPVIVMSSHLQGELEALEVAAKAQGRFDKNTSPEVLVESARRLLVDERSVSPRPAGA